jgi:hypothetical protein
MACWLPIPGYEGLYEVSDNGQVRSLNHTVKKRGRANKVNEHRIRGRVLRSHPANGQGTHLAVMLSRKGKVTRYGVHNLMLRAFVGPPQPGQECCHYDGNWRNNMIANLRWGSHAENLADMARHGVRKGARHHLAKLNDAQVRTIRIQYAAGESVTALAERYGVRHTQIGRIVRRKNWTHIA